MNRIFHLKKITKNLTATIFILFSLLSSGQSYDNKNNEKKTFSIVIHGGTGNITPENLNKEKQILYKDKLSEALSLGEELLKEGKTEICTVE